MALQLNTGVDHPAGHGFSFDYNAFMGVAGSIYVSVASLYSVMLFALMWMFWKARSKPVVKIRGVWLTLGMILTIHVYLVALFVVYPLNGAFHCWIEYTIMNTLLPFGFAYFTCYHLRFVFRAKREAAIAGCVEKNELTKWKNLSRHSHQAAKPWYLMIATTWLTFLVVGAILYGTSRRFHSSYGTFGTWEGEAECRHGPEWIPSIGQQVFWAWFIGPMILYRTRHIRDNHYWHLQTKICVYAGMLGSPLWLAFLYTDNPSIAAMNYYFPPAMWFAPGIIAIQLSSLVLPLWDTHRNVRRDNQNALQSEGLSGSNCLINSRSRWIARTRAALDLQIRYAPKPLLMYAATKDFTAENVQFVVQVRQFKRDFIEAESQSIEKCIRMTAEQLVKLYLQAGQIYYGLINPATAIYPININHAELKMFERVFSFLQCVSNRPDSPTSEVTPWDHEQGPLPFAAPAILKRSFSDRLFRRKGAPCVKQEDPDVPLIDGDSRASSLSQKSWIEDMPVEYKEGHRDQIPEYFNGLVFDEAERHITDLIWKNTFQGFVEVAEPSKLAIYSRFATVAIENSAFSAKYASPRSKMPPSSSGKEVHVEAISINSGGSFSTQTSSIGTLGKI